MYNTQAQAKTTFFPCPPPGTGTCHDLLQFIGQEEFEGWCDRNTDDRAQRQSTPDPVVRMFTDDFDYIGFYVPAAGRARRFFVQVRLDLNPRAEYVIQTLIARGYDVQTLTEAPSCP